MKSGASLLIVEAVAGVEARFRVHFGLCAICVNHNVFVTRLLVCSQGWGLIEGRVSTRAPPSRQKEVALGRMPLDTLHLRLISALQQSIKSLGLDRGLPNRTTLR